MLRRSCVKKSLIGRLREKLRGDYPTDAAAAAAAEATALYL